jgi:signal transduction histidine kinase/AmiR/NasT family two-component response regulator/HPt (histidine-containing phosphotransfer) domain-containing protein
MNSFVAQTMRSPSRGDALLALAALAMIWAAAIFHLTQERELFLRASRDNAQNLSQAFSEHIMGEIRSIDQTLLLLRRDWSRDPAAFELSDWARSTNSIDDLAIQLSLIASTGALLQTNAGRSAPIDLSDREHFIVQKNSDIDTLFVSKPVLGRASGKWTIQFTRKLTDSAGKFAGVVVASVDALQLSHFYETIHVGKHGSIALIGLDGIVRARAPLIDGMLGRKIMASPLSHPDLVGNSGIYDATSELDGIRRLIAYQRVGNLPVVVTVGLSKAEALRPLYQDLAFYLIASIALSAAALCALGISSRHRERHNAAKAALDATLDNVTQGVLMMGPDRRIRVMNPKVAELLDLPAELLAADPTFDDLIGWQLRSGEFGPAMEKTPMRAFVERGGIGSGESVYERQRANGRYLEVRTRVLPDGSAVRTYTDVTEFRRSEQALAEARDAAEQANEARGRFLAVVSHEIRTPMNGVIGLAELLLRTEMSEEQARWVATLRTSADHLLRLIDDILDVTRLNVDEVAFDRVPFDPVAVAGEAFQCIESRAIEKGLAHEIIAPDTSCVVEGDPARLRQILINLLGNAVKFTSSGSVRLFVLAPEIHEDRATLHFLIQDTGIGIAADALPRLFHEFSQVDGSIARRFGGSGLGLAISRQLAERMGGTITVSSEIARGSVFEVSVTLPLSARPVARPSASSAETPAFRPLQVLLAEDDTTNCMVATAMLERMGHGVTWAENGLAALEAATARRFDLILMDMMMPIMDGMAATRAIRALPGAAGKVPIYAFTANAFKEEVECGREAGVDGYLTKPITFDRLLQITGSRSEAERSSAMAEDISAPLPGWHFDEAVVRALGESLGQATAAEICNAFLGELPRRIERLRRAHADRDWEALNREAHSLKSSAAALGLLSASDAAADLERHAAAAAESCGEVLKTLESCLAKGAAGLRAFSFAEPTA